MREHFGVGLGYELVSALHEMRLECGGVLDDPVMNDGDVVLAVDMGVRIAFGRGSMSCLAGVRYAQIAIDWGRGESRFKARDLSGCLARFHAVAVENRNPGGVIPPVFQPLKSVQEE
jgi:hypothetical protein